MNLIDFYLEVFDSLNNNDVDYMLVGGHAVSYHGYVRSTLDMDLWVSTQPSNLDKLFKSFIQLGYNAIKCKEAIYNLSENHIVKIPRKKYVIDIIDSFIVREDFDLSFKNHETTVIGDVKINIIGFNELISCKKKSNRPKDLLDVKELLALKDLQENK